MFFILKNIIIIIIIINQSLFKYQNNKLYVQF